MQQPARDCSRNTGYLSTFDVPEEVWVVGAILVTQDEHGNLGTYFIAESSEYLPGAEEQLDLGQQVAATWAQAQPSHPDYQPGNRDTTEGDA